ncbi:hypothetical protein HDZ31DRAFT_65356 [Schizophyllum fasciatum]
MVFDERKTRIALDRGATLANVSLHRSGFVASPFQRADIDASIDELETVLGDIDAELAHVQAREGAYPAHAQNASGDERDGRDLTVTRLHVLREGVLRQLALCRATIAPVRALPGELLSEIFLLTSQPTSLEVREKRVCAIPALACVCFEWMCAAHATPALWTSIHLGYGTRAHEQPALLAALVARSGALPLDVTLSADDDASSDALHALARLSQHRWRSLTTRQPVLRGAFSLPLLDTLTVSATCVRALDLRALADAPQLRAAALTTQHLFFALPAWPALARLALDTRSVHGAEFRNADRALRLHRRALEALRLVEDEDADAWEEAQGALGEAYEMPRLRAVDMRLCAWPVLRPVVAPRLQTLTLRGCHRSEGLFAELAGGRVLGGHALRELCVVGVDSAPALLEALPGLERLRVVWPRHHTDMAEADTLRWLAFADGAQAHSRLPNLTSFSFVSCLADECTEACRPAVEALMRLRETERSVDGITVKRLDELVTNLGDKYQIR